MDISIQTSGCLLADSISILLGQRLQKMFKAFLLLSLVSTSAFAGPIDPQMTMKDRIRLSLWIEGIDEKPKSDDSAKQQIVLPEEIERALKKL